MNIAKISTPKEAQRGMVLVIAQVLFNLMLIEVVYQIIS